MNNFNPEDYLIFECITGSQLYGLSTPESDTDFRGICIPPKEILLNPFMGFEQKDSGFEEDDRAIYALGKFFKLCADLNPNIIELLFVPEDKIIYNTPAWDMVIKNRILFLSKKAKYTFTGYAFSQAKAIERHRQWFINPPKEKPIRKQFGLTDTPLTSAVNIDSLPYELFRPEVVDELRREREYREVKKQWDNYVAWRDNRNPKRKALEDNFGYDLKYASHIIRLLAEGKELLLTGNITFPLPNAEEIRAIKNGKYSYDEFMVMILMMEKEFETWYEQSVLPNAPDRNKLLELYYDIIGV
jgi:uncharacterized protein